MGACNIHTGLKLVLLGFGAIVSSVVQGSSVGWDVRVPAISHPDPKSPIRFNYGIFLISKY